MAQSNSDAPRIDPSDAVKVVRGRSPFTFAKSPDAELTARILDAINKMGGFGDDAERAYQSAIDGLARRARDVVQAVVAELHETPADRYLDRWSLVHLLAELADPAAQDHLDRLILAALPEDTPAQAGEGTWSPRGEEVMIRTTAVDALARLAKAGHLQARDSLLRHAGHEVFSVRRAAVQAFLEHGGADARERLEKALPERDRHLLDIKRRDVREIPQARPDPRRSCCKPLEELPPLRRQDPRADGGHHHGDGGGAGDPGSGDPGKDCGCGHSK